MPPTCADCGTVGPTSDSPKQQADVPIEQQTPATPRALCSSCFEVAHKAEYRQPSGTGPDAPARPNPGDVPA